MAEHKGQFRLSSMCRVLRVQRSGYYAWKANPKSKRALADDVLLASIRQFFDDSHGIYGSPRILPLMARSNSPTLGHPKFPQAGPPDYDDSGATAMRAAASLRR